MYPILEAERQFKSGVLRGYLAYDGNIAIRWCNANVRLKVGQ
jgi:phage terminase large subunit-like protein